MKSRFTTRLLTHIGLILGLSSVLNMITIFTLPNGGSITLGSMIPIIFISFLYGPSIGFLTGGLFGVINLMLGAYVVHPIQLLLDYPLAFMVLGTAGLFKNHKAIGTFIAIFLRFICHVVSGVVFFSSFTPEGISPIVYSITYNGSYMAIEALISIVIIWFLPVKRLKRILNIDDFSELEKSLD